MQESKKARKQENEKASIKYELRKKLLKLNKESESGLNRYIGIGHSGIQWLL